jgi:hypothetical protein
MVGADAMRAARFAGIPDRAVVATALASPASTRLRNR